MIRLKRRQLSGSQQCAKETLELLRSLLARYTFSSTEQMIRVVKAFGRELSAAAPTELTIGNVVRRVLFCIREEHAHQLNKATTVKENVEVVPSANYNGGQHNPNLLKVSHHFDNMLSHLETRGEDVEEYHRQFPSLKSDVIAAVNDLSTEVDTFAGICQRAPDFIHADETILTYGHSKMVELFLKAASNKRRFQLIIVEGGPSLSGHTLAHHVTTQFPNRHNIAVTLIPDSNVYAIMARVNKVVLCPQAIMADGGCITSAGHMMCAVAAREFSIPVVCLAEAFSLTPLFAHNQTVALQQLLCPAPAMFQDTTSSGETQPQSQHQADVTRHIVAENVTVVNPAFDHLTPELISIYVTNDGSHLPTYVFRQLSEYYHPKDYSL